MLLPSDDIGAGDPVVLLHAGVADRTMWSEHLEPLSAAGYRVVAPDLPGFGEAPAATVEQGPWADVLETMDRVGLDRAALVGCSFGGAVALRVAVIAPERISALALISAPAPGSEPSAQLRAVWDAEESALERGDIEAAVAVIVSAWTLPGAPVELRERVAAMQRRALEVQLAAPPAPDAEDPLDEDPDALARLDVRTLAAAGLHDMPDFRDGAELLARTLPHARHAVIDGAGHLAPLETPDAFRGLLLEFLRAPA
jgi:3-oxoadipate enol-lactonase